MWSAPLPPGAVSAGRADAPARAPPFPAQAAAAAFAPRGTGAASLSGGAGTTERPPPDRLPCGDGAHTTERAALETFAASYSAWPHQVDGFCRAVSENTIVILPTGTGKTLIAAMLIDWFLTAESSVLFVVNNVALVEQQLCYLGKTCRSPWARVVPGHMMEASGVTVGTAASLLNLLPTMDMNRLVLVVFDEVHHATGDHPYVQIMRTLQQFCWGGPRILGLTASWLNGELRQLQQKRQVLESVVGAAIFTPMVDQAYANKAKFQRVAYPDERPELAAGVQVSTLMVQRTAHLHPELAAAFSAQAQKAPGVQASLGEAGLSAFSRAACEVVLGQLNSKVFHTPDEEQVEYTRQALRELPCACELMGVDLATLPTAVGQPSAKAKVLLELMADRPGRTLVFVEQVCCVLPMAAILATHLQEPVLHVSGALSMLKKTRDDHIGEFRAGRCRILVATAALEEGLDVPDCDCVVRFDSFSNVKSHVQGSGRARKVGSEVFYFDNSPEDEDDRTAAMLVGAVQQGGPAVAAGTERGAAPPAERDDAFQLGAGEGHVWGEEETIWDVAANRSFRGQRCAACPSLLRITSRAYGKGRKKKERVFSVDGQWACGLRTEMPYQ